MLSAPVVCVRCYKYVFPSPKLCGPALCLYIVRVSARRQKEMDECGEDQFTKNRILSAMYVETGTAKQNGVVEYVKELCEAGEKFIIFATHIAMMRAIQSCVEKEGAGYMMIMGETPALERREGVARFQGDEKCRVAILSLGAASQGITLTAAST